MKSQERLAVSTEGMRELHAGRPPWTLVKELIQNCWDEAPEATRCDVTVRPSKLRGHAFVDVVDDGPGFANIADAYTLMGPTAKRSNPTKRGRFNLGEKEILSVARSAEISTVGYRVLFPPGGGRDVRRDGSTDRGTVVSVHIPWNRQQQDALIWMLKRFRPTDCALVVNGAEVPKRIPVASPRVQLSTVLQHAPGHPMVMSRRYTAMDILTPLDDARWLYELGIPVQPIDCAFDVDVRQKIPLAPNRNMVSQAYLQDIHAEVLNATHHLLEGEDFAAPWVRNALEDKRMQKSTVRNTIIRRYGDKVALWSSNTDSNMKAAESGYTVLHPRTMSPEERTHLRVLGGLGTTQDLFGRGAATQCDTVEPDSVKLPFADWVRRLADRCGMTVQIRFVRSKSRVVADCGGSASNPTIRFNLVHLNDDWFAQRGAAQFELVVHELAHALADAPMEHGPKWGEACCRVAGVLLTK